MTEETLQRLYRQFDGLPAPTEITPFGGGHINHTYLVKTAADSYVLQMLSPAAFRDPDAVMENIRRVTQHLQSRGKLTLEFIQTKSGSLALHDESGVWRLYRFVDGLCLERAEQRSDFYECGVGFGSFLEGLADIPVGELQETIPDFHHTPKRLAALKAAAEADVCGRAASVRAELDFAFSREPFTNLLLDAHAAGDLPLRVVHNDTKLNNLLLDRQTRKALCVIDLDTVMPGFSVADFGDAIRYGANTAAEDERDLSKVHLDLTLFRAFTEGFFRGCGSCLTATEVALLPTGAKMMTLECGIRFLTDYLSGDPYFRIAYPEQNLVRCRKQFRLVEELEAHWDEMNAIVRDCAVREDYHGI